MIYCNCFTIALSIILIGLPLFVLFFYNAKIDRLDDEKFKARYGTLLEGTKIYAEEGESESDLKRKRQISILFPLFFMLRRMVFVGIAFMLAQWPVFQLVGQFYLNTLMIIYLLWCWPLETNFSTLVEVFNEVTAMWMLYFMLTFTDWVPDIELRYQTGWVFIGIFCLNLSVHILFLLKDLKDSIRDKYLKCKNRKAKSEEI